MSCFSVLLDYVPLVFVLIMCIYGYYSYIVVYCIFYLENPAKKYSFIAFFNIFFIMFVWSYLQTIFATHPKVPEEYKLTPEEHARLSNFSEKESTTILKKLIVLRQIEVLTCSEHGNVRYCQTCRGIKPDRTHHCSTCGRCILKMDHHCPWVVNCIGFANYKGFVLTLMYATVWTTFYVGTVVEVIILLWRDVQNNLYKVHICLGFIFAGISGLLVSILFLYHLGLLFRNETTLESLRDVTFIDNNSTFDMGAFRNFLQVFGNNACLWLIPVGSSIGNGYEFPVNKVI